MTPPTTPPAIAGIGTDEPLDEGCDVGVEEDPGEVTVRVTTSTRSTRVGKGCLGSGMGMKKDE